MCPREGRGQADRQAALQCEAAAAHVTGWAYYLSYGFSTVSHAGLSVLVSEDVDLWSQ